MTSTFDGETYLFDVSSIIIYKIIDSEYSYEVILPEPIETISSLSLNYNKDILGVFTDSPITLYKIKSTTEYEVIKTITDVEAGCFAKHFNQFLCIM